MSCDWDVRCLDCEVDHGFYDCNHESELMMTLARKGPELKRIAPLMKELGKTGEVRLVVRYNDRAVNFEWFAVHGDHRLRAVNEYGECIDECGEYFTYCECGHRLKCHRNKGHDGKHAEKRDDATTSPSEVKK